MHPRVKKKQRVFWREGRGKKIKRENQERKRVRTWAGPLAKRGQEMKETMKQGRRRARCHANRRKWIKGKDALEWVWAKEKDSLQ